MELFKSLTKRDKISITVESISIMAILTGIYYISFVLAPAMLTK